MCCYGLSGRMGRPLNADLVFQSPDSPAKVSLSRYRAPSSFSCAEK